MRELDQRQHPCHNFVIICTQYWTFMQHAQSFLSLAVGFGGPLSLGIHNKPVNVGMISVLYHVTRPQPKCNKSPKTWLHQWVMMNAWRKQAAKAYCQSRGSFVHAVLKLCVQFGVHLNKNFMAQVVPLISTTSGSTVVLVDWLLELCSMCIICYSQ